jgi:hypothetical protein
LQSDYFLRYGASYTHMQSAAPIRFLVVASFAFTALLTAQSAPSPQPNRGAVQVASTLPATPPTTAPDLPLLPSQKPPQRAQVTYANDTLTVFADNSSLNQILRQISSAATLKITGGVTDERVFGQYGPAPLAQILAELLDGTDSNMLLTHPDGATSQELILTPRQGGPTPPNPNAAAFDERPEPEQPAPEPEQPAAALPPGNRTIVPITPAPSATGTAPTDGSQPDSPNGVKTPQQIYEQLQRMRQQQQQTQTPPQ